MRPAPSLPGLQSPSVEQEAPPLLDPLLEPLLEPLLDPLEPLLDPLLLDPPLLDPLLLPEVPPLEVPVQHWMLSGPGHSPAVEVPPCAEQAEVSMHCPDSPFAVQKP